MLSRRREGALLTKLERSLGFPVVPVEHARALGDASLGKFGRFVQEADFVFFLGKRIDFSVNFGNRATFAANCNFAIVDPDADALQQSVNNLDDRTVLCDRADARLVASKLAECQSFQSSAEPSWNKRVDEALAYRPQYSTPVDTEIGITPQFVCEALTDIIHGCTARSLIVDGGEFGQWAQAFIDQSPRVTNGLSGAIGAGVCYAIAAKLHRPDATVFAIMGDGTIGFHLGEFETAVRYELPFIAIVGNDAGWNAEHQIQLRDYGSDRLIGCELTPARYDLAVAGLGGHGEYVCDADEFGAAVERAIASDLPACVNIQLEGRPAPSFT